MERPPLDGFSGLLFQPEQIAARRRVQSAEVSVRPQDRTEHVRGQREVQHGAVETRDPLHVLVDRVIPEAGIHETDMLGREEPLSDHRDIIPRQRRVRHTSRQAHRSIPNLRREQVVDVPTLLVVTDDQIRGLTRDFLNRVDGIPEVVRIERDSGTTATSRIDHDTLPPIVTSTSDTEVGTSRLDASEEAVWLEGLVTRTYTSSDAATVATSAGE